MKIRNLFLLSIVSAFMLTASCKKYPDGPLLSSQTKEKRVSGRWGVEYFSINGYDSTAYLKSQRYHGFYEFRRRKDGRREFGYNSYGNYGTDTSHQFYVGGMWDFRNFKNSLLIEKIDNVGAPWRHFNLGLFSENGNIFWEIRKLTENEMWLTGNYSDGREYYFRLKQI
jgi:hypothetical protein